MSTFVSEHIRRAAPDDASSVRALVRSAYAKWVAAIGREPLPMVADYDRAVRDHEIDLLDADGELIGLIELIQNADHLLIENIAVAPAHQGQGIGRGLLAHAERKARGRDVAEIRLSTNAAFESNIRLYRLAGFRIDRREPFMGGEAVYMSKKIASPQRRRGNLEFVRRGGGMTRETMTSDLHEGYFYAGLESDPELAEAISGELRRQRDGIELIASENIVSRLVLEAQGSVLTNKTVEGLPYRRYYGGAEFADAIEALAVRRARELFGCRFANVQPHSGSNANAGVFLGLLKLGDVILSMNIAAGGHISHGHPATLTGRDYKIATYGVHPRSEWIDLDEVRDLALRNRPKMIVAGGSAYPRAIDFAAFRAIADEVGAYLLVDMAHFAGLVATGLHPNPFPHAHVVTTTTYKSLRGARGGMALWNEERLSNKINYGIFPGVQGSVLMHGVAGKAACLGEAARPEFRRYNQSVLDNAGALAGALGQLGSRIVSGGTDTGLMLVDLRAKGVTGDIAADALEKAGLAVNKNMIPFDPRPPESPSGLRLSSNAGTTRGFAVPEFQAIAGWIDRVLQNPGDDQAIAAVGREVRALCARHPIY